MGGNAVKEHPIDKIVREAVASVKAIDTNYTPKHAKQGVNHGRTN